MRLPRVVSAATVLAAVLAVVLAGCAGGTDSGPGSGSDSGKLTVATASYPLTWTVQRLAGDDATVEDVIRPGVEPHDAELTVEQTAMLTDADLVVYGEGLAPAVDDVADGLDDSQQVEVSNAARVVDSDPHFWLDPTRVRDVAVLVADRLAEADPQHAEDYRARLATLERELTRLDDAYRRGLADCTRRTVVVSHEAYDYLGRRYDLDLEAIAGLSPEAEPSPAHLLALRDLAQREGITTVFTERLGSPALARTLASELGLSVAVLDPIEGLTEETSGEDYLSLMRQNLAALETANGCS